MKALFIDKSKIDFLNEFFSYFLEKYLLISGSQKVN